MFRITDRYIVSKFIKSLFFTVTAFLIIFIVVDVVEKMDTFIDRGASVNAIIHYYLLALPNFIIIILPIAMLLASLFTMGKLVKYGELTALKSAGISLYRIALPIFAFGIMISVFSFLFGEIVVASSEREKSRLYREQIQKIPNLILSRYNITIQEINNRLVTISHYDGKKRVGTQVNIWVLNGSRIDTTISAQTLVGDGNEWILRDGKVRDFTTGEEIVEEFRERRISEISLKEEDLVSVRIEPEEMNVFELREYIQHLKQIGNPYERWLVDYHNKFAFPFANLIVVLVGLPLATNLWRGGAGVGFGVGIFISFIYYVIMTFTLALGYKGILQPVAAAWFSNAFFGLFGLTSLYTARK